MAKRANARPRIKTLAISDFRAFPGPGTVAIELDGKNLFLYGENGVGKSTIFHALNRMFAHNWSPEELREELEEQANRFTPADEKGKSSVTVTYDDGLSAAIWSLEGHPTSADPGPADERIVNAAWAKAILDYRSLLETNYDHGDDEVNLFHVCVDHLLRDYPTITGERLGAIWQRLQDKLEFGQLREAQLKEINDDSRALNAGLTEALTHVLPLINPFLDQLGYGDIRLDSLTAKRIAYNNSSSKDGRDYDDREVLPEISFHGRKVEYPQHFLNEAPFGARSRHLFRRSQTCGTANEKRHASHHGAGRCSDRTRPG